MRNYETHIFEFSSFVLSNERILQPNNESNIYIGCETKLLSFLFLVFNVEIALHMCFGM